MKYRSLQFALAAILACGLFSGCSLVIDNHSQKRDMMSSYVCGNRDNALALAGRKIESTTGQGDELVWRLEAGSINFDLGKYEAALNEFRRAEELIQEYDERAVVSLRDAGAEGASLLTNPNALPYRGFCRDRVALGIYKCLAYLGQGKEGAFRAQAKRLREEHKKIQEDFEKFFDEQEKETARMKEENKEAAEKMASADYYGDVRNAEYATAWEETKAVGNKGYGGFLNPATLFLSGLSLARDGKWDNARIEFQRLYEAMPNNPVMQQYYVTALTRASRKIPSELAAVQPFGFPLENNAVFVIFACGQTASLRQVGINFPVQAAWPVCEFHPMPPQQLQVSAANAQYPTAMLADMDAIFAQEFSIRQPAIITRVILSCLVKEAAYHGTLAAIKNSSGGKSSAGKEAAMIAAAIGGWAYKSAMNTADTRSWECLPKEFQLTQFPMPADRKVRVTNPVNGNAAADLTIPAGCGSAIIYVSAPGPVGFTYHVFPLK